MSHQQGRQTGIETFLLCCVYIKLRLHGKTLPLNPTLKDSSTCMSKLRRKVLLNWKNFMELSGLFKLNQSPAREEDGSSDPSVQGIMLYLCLLS